MKAVFISKGRQQKREIFATYTTTSCQYYATQTSTGKRKTPENMGKEHENTLRKKYTYP